MLSLTRPSDEYELENCCLHELVSLGLQCVGSQYTEWGMLACSTLGDTIYVTDFRLRTQVGKKGVFDVDI